MMYEVNTRIQLIRQELGLSRRVFGEPLAASDSVIKNLENNLTEPKPAFIDLICRTYNVNRAWLLAGEGEMFNDLTKDEQLAEFVGTVLGEEDDSFKKRFLNMLSNLSDDGWAFLEQMVDDLAKQKEDGEK